MICCKAMATKRTVDDRMAYWFPWKHPMAGRRVLEFGVFDQTLRKWAPRLGPTGLAIRLFRRLCTKTQPKCGLAFRALQMHHAPIFRPCDVRLAVSDVLLSTQTTPSVSIRIFVGRNLLAILLAVFCYHTVDTNIIQFCCHGNCAAGSQPIPAYYGQSVRNQIAMLHANFR